MKNIILLLSISILLFGCDKVCEPYPENIVVGSQIAFTTVAPELATTGNVAKDILLEDYTGFKCTNCPDAHVVADALREEHGSRINVMAMHVTSTFAAPDMGAVYPEPFSQDFRTDDGEIYLTEFGLQQVPTGIINRTKYGNFIDLGFADWDTQIDALIDEESALKMDFISAAYVNDSIDISLTFEFLEDLVGSYYFTVSLIENEVISAQIDGGTQIDDYVQKDVFRGTLNGTWGELLKEDPMDMDFAYVNGRYPVPALFNEPGTPNEEIDINNCHIIVYVYESNFDNQIFDVLQVKKKDLVQ